MLQDGAFRLTTSGRLFALTPSVARQISLDSFSTPVARRLQPSAADSACLPFHSAPNLHTQRPTHIHSHALRCASIFTLHLSVAQSSRLAHLAIHTTSTRVRLYRCNSLSPTKSYCVQNREIVPNTSYT
jgi:hypothetical protein